MPIQSHSPPGSGRLSVYIPFYMVHVMLIPARIAVPGYSAK
nr:MAG TPA: hypothetical protein [Caudoviricetes sp.]